MAVGLAGFDAVATVVAATVTEAAADDTAGDGVGVGGAAFDAFDALEVEEAVAAPADEPVVAGILGVGND